jgi:hypothetical protein
VLWAKSGRGVENNEAKGIAIDLGGNVYITGVTASPTLTFDTIKVVNNFSSIMFMAKFSSSGKIIWAKTFDGSGFVYEGSSITVDKKNYVYVTGFFNSTIIFGKDTLKQTTDAPTPRMFLVKFDGFGNHVWAKSYENASYSIPSSIATDSDGNICLTGYTENNAYTYYLLVKYGGNGELLWEKQTVITKNSSRGRGVITDVNNNIYVHGEFANSKFLLGDFSLINSNTNSKEDGWYSDIFVVKYAASGNLVWAKSAGCQGSDHAKRITIDDKGDLYITGYFSEYNFKDGSKDGFKIGDTTATLQESDNGIYVAKLKLSNK